jgi:hypothetical protein
MHYLYGSEHRIRQVLKEMPDRQWDGLAIKPSTTYNPRPIRVDYDCVQWLIVDWFGQAELDAYGGKLDPLDDDYHAMAIHARALHAAKTGFDGFFVDPEMYGSDETKLPDEPICVAHTEDIRRTWHHTFMCCLDINPWMIFGGTGFARVEPNGVYDAIVDALHSGKKFHDITQWTYAAGWSPTKLNEWKPALEARHPNLEFVTGVDVSRDNRKWFDNDERFPDGWAVCVVDAKELLKRDAEYIDALMAIGKPEIRAGGE